MELRLELRESERSEMTAIWSLRDCDGGFHRLRWRLLPQIADHSFTTSTHIASIGVVFEAILDGVRKVAVCAGRFVERLYGRRAAVGCGRVTTKDSPGPFSGPPTPLRIRNVLAKDAPCCEQRCSRRSSPTTELRGRQIRRRRYHQQHRPHTTPRDAPSAWVRDLHARWHGRCATAPSGLRCVRAVGRESIFSPAVARARRATILVACGAA